MMKLQSRRRVVTLVSGLSLLAVAGLLSGCGEQKSSLSKDETAAIHKPLGQPMPPQAAAAMAAHGAGGAPAQASKTQ